jgi:TRAP-type C4-dicarboxylate transport system substrate-binding protein
MAEKMARALGVSAFVKPAPESYELLSSGVADGIFFPIESIPGFKLETVVKYATIFPGGFYSSAFGFFMNQEKFDKLAKEDQDVIMAESGEKLTRLAGKVWDESDRRAYEILHKTGVQFTEASPAFIKEVKEKAVVLEREWIAAANAKGIDGEKVLKAFHAELAKVEAGK